MDFSNAYRRLSDANLAFSGSSLANLPMRTRKDHAHGRLVKDYLGPDGEPLSSDEDEQFSSSDEDRGRKKDPRALDSDSKTQKSMSLLGAAEEERKCVPILTGADLLTFKQVLKLPRSSRSMFTDLCSVNRRLR